MIDEQTSIKIKDLEFDNSFLENKLSIAQKERNIAILEAQKTLEERNEALIMFSNELSKGNDGK